MSSQLREEFSPCRFSTLLFVALCATLHMAIKTFKHKGLRAYFETGNVKGIKPAHAARLSRLLYALNRASEPNSMNFPGNDFHKLKGDYRDFFAVSVNGNWRLIFTFDGTDAVLVDYRDYH
ncbi:type II toxin-antitoxin system RelE/ParE family toxin [Caballeronia sordidicola]|uniref:type II toxin-antitoxin system RelE/ParE family toxin n=1 Tax=Caballeronia sordidicola TaxID=196367 RepID=UPI002E12AA8C